MRIQGRIEIPAKLRAFLSNPSPEVNETMKRTNKLILTLLQESIKSNIWHNKTEKLKASIKTDTEKWMVFADIDYAPAQEKGHYATPVNKKILHFVDGGKDVFLRFTRSKPQPFFFKAISQNKQQILEIFDDEVKNLLERI